MKRVIQLDKIKPSPENMYWRWFRKYWLTATDGEEYCCYSWVRVPLIPTGSLVTLRTATCWNFIGRFILWVLREPSPHVLFWRAVRW